MAIASITLDEKWLRRIRGRISQQELDSACDLADEDIRTWLRRLYGVQGLDAELEVILDANGDPLNVAEEIIAEYEGNPDHANYAHIKKLADMTASLFAIEWADFMAGEDVGETNQMRSTSRAVVGRKKRIEAVGYLTKIDGTVRKFQRFMEHRGIMTKRKTRA